MSISSAINSAANSYVKSTAANSAKSTTTSSTPASVTPMSDASKTKSDNSNPSNFGEMLTQASLSSVPSKTLSPEVLAATVPESNTFLQAIRQMMGKPLEAPSTKELASTSTSAIASTTAAALTPFGNLPAATTSMPTPDAKKDLPGEPKDGTSSAADFMSSIEAQLSYQSTSQTTATPEVNSNAASSLTTSTDNGNKALSNAIEAAKTQTNALATSASGTPIASNNDLVDQFIAGASAAAVAGIQSALVEDLTQETQAA